jgi:hypothetical protein
MTYLSYLDDSQAEIIAGGLADTNTAVLGISLTLLNQFKSVTQTNAITNTITSAPAFLSAPLVAASIVNTVTNLAVLS